LQFLYLLIGLVISKSTEKVENTILASNKARISTVAKPFPTTQTQQVVTQFSALLVVVNRTR